MLWVQVPSMVYCNAIECYYMEYRRSSLGKHSENTISEISTISTISENMQLEKSMLQLNIERKRLHNVMRFSDFEII